MKAYGVGYWTIEMPRVGYHRSCLGVVNIDAAFFRQIYWNDCKMDIEG